MQCKAASLLGGGDEQWCTAGWCHDQAYNVGHQQLANHVHLDSSRSISELLSVNCSSGYPEKPALGCLPVGMVLHATGCLLCSAPCGGLPGGHSSPACRSRRSCGLPPPPLPPLGCWGAPGLSVGLTLHAASGMMSSSQSMSDGLPGHFYQVCCCVCAERTIKCLS